MDLVDVNVLVYAHRADAADHSRYLNWLEQLIRSDQAYGTADIPGAAGAESRLAFQELRFHGLDFDMLHFHARAALAG